MKIPSVYVFMFLLLGTCCLSIFAEEPTPPKQETVVEEVANNKFRQALLKAAQDSAKKGELKRFDVVKLRVATLSPAFLEQAQQLAVIQMAFSGEDLGDLPVNDEGKIEVNRIDWEGLILFLERLIPLILKLIDLFAMYQGPLNFEQFCEEILFC